MAKVKLLNIDANAKTVKGQSKGYMTAVLYLAPFKLSGYQVCPMAEVAGCIADCLNTAGRGGIAPAGTNTTSIEFGNETHTVKLNTIQKARIARTRFFHTDPQGFMRQLVKEIHAAQRKADRRDLTLVVRLNGTSDIRWENVFMNNRMRVPRPYNIFEMFPGIQFYDYTKIANRRVSHIPNYHLTFSFSDRAQYLPNTVKAIQNYEPGFNMAVVFMGKLPDTFMGRTVINGDESDLRFLDPKGVIVGLKAKGNARRSKSGFAVAA